jgi:hypothetical protein
VWSGGLHAPGARAASSPSRTAAIRVRAPLGGPGSLLRGRRDRIERVIGSAAGDPEGRGNVDFPRTWRVLSGHRPADG